MEKKDPLDFLGSTYSPLDHEKEAVRNIKIVIRVRWFVSPFVFLILATSSFIGLSFEKGFSLFTSLINTSIILLFNIIYKMLLKKKFNLRFLSYMQLFIDALHFSFTIYNTGGITSPFSFLYFCVILASAVLISGSATIFSALLSSILYSLVIVLELFNVLPHKNYFIPLSGMSVITSYIVLKWLFTIASFFALGALCSYLFSEIRKRQIKLRIVNKRLDYKVNILTLLYRTSETLNKYTRIMDVVDFILSELLETLRLDRALIYFVVDNAYLKLYMVMHKKHSKKGELDVEIPLDENAGLTAYSAIRKIALNIKDPVKSPLINRKLAGKIGMNPFALAPLIVQDRTIGVIGIDRSEQNGAINDDEFQILKIFANSAAIALNNFL
ncbi:MAG: GAF domain-containing protein [Spirochaetales bacterium]|nr:GAF domain-containing protein [Spirochaetales bacterium]